MNDKSLLAARHQWLRTFGLMPLHIYYLIYLSLPSVQGNRLVAAMFANHRLSYLDWMWKMSSEYEPKDSRNVTGAAHTKDGRWSGDKEARSESGEYEPADSRNVTGVAKTPDRRWTKRDDQVDEA